MANVGFVSVWFERGAAYVTKAYVDLIKSDHNVFVYARGGEYQAKGNEIWDKDYVTWGYRLFSTRINYSHIKKWIEDNRLDTIFFNEQSEFEILSQIKIDFPEIKLGTYIDYYKEDTVHMFNMYDFLICNTKRHFDVFKSHPQVFFIPWGTDTELYSPTEQVNNELTFFHSVGMSTRKGTDILLKTFIEKKLYTKSKLIIHSQLNFQTTFGYSEEELKNYNIQLIQKTVTAPGLYSLGDVYVYPTTLDGLGLTMYEALSSGLPVITTDNGPMNEIIDSNNGRLVSVDYYRSRADAYYWPLSICNSESLSEAMLFYINNPERLKEQKLTARENAIKKYNWMDRKKEVLNAFENTNVTHKEINYKDTLKILKRKRRNHLLYELTRFLPSSFEEKIFVRRIEKNNPDL